MTTWSEPHEEPRTHSRHHLARSIGVPPRRYTRSWNGLSAEIVEVHGPGPYVADLRSDKPRLAAVLEAVGGHVDIRPEPDCPGPSRPWTPHQLAFLPASLPAWEYAERFHYIRRIAIDFDPVLLGPTTGTCAQCRALVTLSSAHLRSLAHLLADECKVAAASQTYGASLGLVISHNLAAFIEAQRPTPSTGGLAPWRLRRAIEYMERCWHGSVVLTDLARAAGLSRSYFSRAFHASTGMAPRRWLLALRVRRAQQMLLETDAPISYLALTCGFADQSHFTHAFRAVTGETPGAWRKSREPQLSFIADRRLQCPETAAGVATVDLLPQCSSWPIA